MNFNQFGFTLIELMVAAAIVAILSAVAIPSYNRYVIKNAESRAQTRMLSIEIELERWRASTLTYRNFQPSLSTTVDNYTITLVNGAGASLASDTVSTSWVMLAVPSSDFQNRGAARFLLTSTGLKCKSIDSNFCATVGSACTCGVGTKEW